MLEQQEMKKWDILLMSIIIIDRYDNVLYIRAQTFTLKCPFKTLSCKLFTSIPYFLSLLVAFSQNQLKIVKRPNNRCNSGSVRNIKPYFFAHSALRS